MKRNLITDVAGLRVGNAADATLRSGVTVLTSDAPLTCGVHIMGGAPGTRETALLAPDKLVQQVDALVLSGGSAFGLAAADGVADGLRRAGRGFPAGPARVPIVPAAILFDLANGGDKDWDTNPYSTLGTAAFDDADESFEIGTAGAGFGATVAGLVGGLGSASLTLPNGHTVGAVVAVNAIGAPVADQNGRFWAAPWEEDNEFGGRGIAPQPDTTVKTKLDPQATTIAIVATDATLDQAGCTRMATAAHDGMARALVPSHTLFDGDLVFGVSTGARALHDPLADPILLGHAAATCLARAIARGVYSATGWGPDAPLRSWTETYS
ncbi:MAG: P1 family peptidase [Pseudomonadota bacterium]